ncbi:hypothetical protein LSAT2_023296 [Lamellibrachia satsuma]|nr:hypothetical protein LSAT2_023296 [Lamellibrachia satsuma]
MLLLPDVILGGFTKPRESRISETRDVHVMYKRIRHACSTNTTPPSMLKRQRKVWSSKETQIVLTPTHNTSVSSV